MSSPMKEKGARAEREVQALLRDLLGVPARRKLGAGRLDDMGDLDGVPDTCIAVANYKDIARALREKVDPCVTQQERAGATFGATFIRRPGGRYLVVQTPTQWSQLWLRASA
jgi:hypothetical protein